MSDIVESLWIEKYRPKKLDDLVLPEQYMNDFRKIIERGSLPNLLLSGPPGGGKSTLARVLCSKHGVLQNKKDNLLYINGSARKSRGIGFVDDVIEPFLKHPPSRDDYRVVFIDEADNLTGDSYNSLRAVIEKYHVAYGRFIFTCNYISKIPDAIQSRFIPYIFRQIPKEFIFDYCIKILMAEKIEYVDKDIKMIVNNLYPDVRKIVNVLQRSSWNGKLDVKEEAIVTSERKVTSFIVQIISLIEKGQDNKIGGVVTSIVDLIGEQQIEYRNVYSDLFFMDKVPAPAKIVINQYSNTHQNCLIPHMHFMAMVFNIIKSLQEYRRTVTGK
jgi:DNA polymerase III delta prime subunit